MPSDLAADIDERAHALSISRNEALILLARRGRDAIVEEDELKKLRLAIERAIAAGDTDPPPPGYPSANEYAEAILGPRGDPTP